MSQPAVVFDSVWKKFARGERHDSLRDLVPWAAKRLLGREKSDELAQREFWALSNVAFEVHPGQALGIIGPNGAGKSTTLKLLTKILRPTRGRCHVVGRVGALIEVAAGFHPDLTGLENIFLQGAIMGMKRAEIAKKLDEIVEFAGVSGFIDTPVKRYSSGMNARLGFSIAAHLDPDVMIIDEVLSVGDSAFQDRCVKRMQDFKKQGVTIVFVSHNLQAVSSLCDEAILLHREVRASGPTATVLRTYVQSYAGQPTPELNSDLNIVAAALSDPAGNDVEVLAPSEKLRLRVDYAAAAAVRDVTFGFMLYRSTDRLIVYEGNFPDHEVGIRPLKTGDRFSVCFEFSAHLARGEYFIECYVLHNPTHTFMSTLSPAAMFSVEEMRTCRGVVDIGLSASVIDSRPATLSL